MPNSYKKETFATRLEGLSGSGRHRTVYEELAKIAAGKGRKAVTKQAVARWIDGSATPDALSIENLAKHFSVSKEWLFFGDSAKHPISMDIAKAVDLIPENERLEVARDVARRLDNVQDIPLGTSHDSFTASLKILSEALKKQAKPPH